MTNHLFDASLSRILGIIESNSTLSQSVAIDVGDLENNLEELRDRVAALEQQRSQTEPDPGPIQPPDSEFDEVTLDGGVLSLGSHSNGGRMRVSGRGSISAYGVDGLTITGDLDAVNYKYAYEFNESTNIRLQGCQSRGSQGGVWFGWGGKVDVDQCVLSVDGREAGVRFEGFSNATLTNSTIISAYKHCVRFHGKGDTGIVRNCLLNGPRGSMVCTHAGDNIGTVYFDNTIFRGMEMQCLGLPLSEPGRLSQLIMRGISGDISELHHYRNQNYPYNWRFEV